MQKTQRKDDSKPDFYIVLSLHFHQPHFQLQEVRDEVFRNCYYPMMDMLEGISDDGNLKLNLHISGPLINYASRHEMDFLSRMKGEVDAGKVKIVGGLIDESFPQLSSRMDDTYFQMVRYGIATERFFGVPMKDWDGFHIVEREVGEILLYQLSTTMEDMGALPIFYLDVETFFTPYFGSVEEENLSLKHFGVVDPALKSTMPYFTKDALFSIYRDEILGSPFYVVPIHSELRYFLLKRRPIFGPDPTYTPMEYLDVIRNKAEVAADLLYRKSNKEIPPLMLIFNDAELFGQWSGDPGADREWMEEFFKIVIESGDASFTSMREYFEKFGYVDTYPIKTSTSYQEFENWTMKRGIRGITFGDPKLRRVISCLRQLEKAQERVEKVVLDRVSQEIEGSITHILMSEIAPRVLSSRSRYDFIRVFMAEYYSEDILKAYDLVHTIRNLTYQEDPRWASRHPNFGSCTYYDLTGLAYIAVADRLADYLLNEITETWGRFPKTGMEIVDWDYDGNDEVVIDTDQQYLVISKVAGTVIHHQIHSPYFKGMDFKRILAAAQTLVTEMPMFPATGFYSQALIHTEPDSELCVHLEDEDSRVEYCRDAYRANFVYRDDSGSLKVMGSFDYKIFELTDHSIEGDTITVIMEASEDLICEDGTRLKVSLTKTFTIIDERFTIKFRITKLGDEENPHWKDVLFVPELVNSVTPADDIDGKLESFIRLNGDNNERKIALRYQVTNFSDNGGRFTQDEFTETIFPPNRLQYILSVKTPLYGSFYDCHNYTFSDDSVNLMEDMEISPAVHRFYRGYVFDNHSYLGYHQSGAKVSPIFRLAPGGVTEYEISLNREILEIGKNPDIKEGGIPLINTPG